MAQMGQTLSTRVTAPIAAFAGVAVRAFGQQEDAERKLRAALQANGRQVESLFNRYNQFASEMQRTTIIGDETTLAMLQQAESLGLTADSAERAVKNSIAMQSAFGVNAESAIRYTAALEQGNATMLTRYIPTLRDIEDESERVAEAQRVLGNAFSVAESEAQGAMGQFTQFKNAVGDLMEVIGGLVAEAIAPLVTRLKAMAESLQQTDRATLKLYGTIGLIVAAIGPAIWIIGKLITVLGLVLTPIAAKIAAISALVLAFEYVRRNLDVFINRIHRGFVQIRNIVIEEVDRILKVIQDWARFLPGHTALAVAQTRAILSTLTGDIPEIEGEFQGAGEFIQSVISDIGQAFEWLSDKIFTGGFGGGLTDGIKEFSRELGAEVDVITAHYQRMARNGAETIGKLHLVTQEGAQKIPDSLRDMSEQADEIGQALQSTMTNAAVSFAESFGQMVASAGKGESFFNNLLGMVADFASQLGRIIVGIGVAMLQLRPERIFTNPAGAIAAGAALIALGAALRSVISAGPGGSGGGGASFQPSARSVPEAGG